MAQGSREQRRIGWLAATAIAGTVLVAGAAIVVGSGRLDLWATTPDSPLFGNIVHSVFRRAAAVQSADVAVPGDLADPARIAIGAAHFANFCANCHGGPGFGQSPAALAMSPRPPWLPAYVKGVDDRELYWVIKHGVKLTAMPGWTSQRRDDEVWSLVAFVRTLSRQTQATFRRSAVGDAEGPEAAALPLIPFGQASAQQPYASFNSGAPQVTVNSFTTPAWGPADFSRDANPLLTCARCHGVAGRGRVEGGFPNLTGQTASRLRQELERFASGKRQSGIMQSVAAQLSPAQMDGVARHYAGQTPAMALSAPTGPAIALDASVCNGCHGLSADHALVYPQLRGQDRKYLANQLRLFRDGVRDEIGMPDKMARLAHGLSEAQIERFAAYFAGLQPIDPDKVADKLPEDER